MEATSLTNPSKLKVYLDGKVLKGVTGFKFEAVPEDGLIAGKIKYAYLSKEAWGINEITQDVIIHKINGKVLRLISVEEGSSTSDVRDEITARWNEEEPGLAEGMEAGDEDDEGEDEDEDDSFHATLGQNP